VIEGEDLQEEVEVGYVSGPSDIRLTLCRPTSAIQFIPCPFGPISAIGDGANDFVPFSPVRGTERDVVLEQAA
jgi:hypothetical protein